MTESTNERSLFDTLNYAYEIGYAERLVFTPETTKEQCDNLHHIRGLRWCEAVTKAHADEAIRRDRAKRDTVLRECAEALKYADKSLTTIRNASGTTLNPFPISQEAYYAHENVRAALAALEGEKK